MEEHEVPGVVQHFKDTMKNDPRVVGPSTAVVAILSLLKLIKESKAETVVGLTNEIKKATEALIKATPNTVSVSSGCELFLRFITLTSLDHDNFQELQKQLIERGNLYLKQVEMSRGKIATAGYPFIRDETTILIHSRSRVVMHLLREAVHRGKRLKVFITASAIDGSGKNMEEMLKQDNIPSKVILDSAVGFIMEKVDVVIVGADGVSESGGIINKIGTYQIAVMAKALNRPFYVVAESFKFVRQFPLKQDDLPNEEKYATVDSGPDKHPSLDYTPPQYITLLFTDLGVLTPSAVSDELIKLYM